MRNNIFNTVKCNNNFLLNTIEISIIYQINVIIYVYKHSYFKIIFT